MSSTKYVLMNSKKVNNFKGTFKNMFSLKTKTVKKYVCLNKENCLLPKIGYKAGDDPADLIPNHDLPSPHSPS